MLADEQANLKLGSIDIGVSLEQGVPALLLFRLLQNNYTISKRTEMKTNKAVFHLGRHFRGRFQLKVEVKLLNRFRNLNKCFLNVFICLML